MKFFNEQVDLAELPSLENIYYTPLEKSYLRVLYISMVIWNLFLWALFIIFLILKPFEAPFYINYIITGLLSLNFIWSSIAIIKGFAFKGFALREKDIIYRTGWLKRRITIAPFNRVQHVGIDQGPIERYVKLSKLKIFTAGGSTSDLTIPGLTLSSAQKLKAYIVDKASDEEE